MTKTFEIWCDGACSGNPGPGGWATILVSDNEVKETSGGVVNTTNQRMELTAAIEGLKILTQPSDVRLYSDSAYLINCFKRRWYVNWIKNGWKNKKGDNVANRDLWEELLKLTKQHNVEFIKVKGHGDNEYNNRCDKLAVTAKPIIKS